MIIIIYLFILFIYFFFLRTTYFESEYDLQICKLNLPQEIWLQNQNVHICEKWSLLNLSERKHES
jgi:hypothetical protein